MTSYILRMVPSRRGRIRNVGWTRKPNIVLSILIVLVTISARFRVLVHIWLHMKNAFRVDLWVYVNILNFNVVSHFVIIRMRMAIVIFEVSESMLFNDLLGAIVERILDQTSCEAAS